MDFEKLKKQAEKVAAGVAAAMAASDELVENIRRAGEALTAENVEELHRIYNPQMLRERTQALDDAIENARQRQQG